MSDRWANLTADQHKVLSITGKIAEMKGFCLGLYFAAEMSGNEDAKRMALDMKRDMGIASTQVCELFNREPTNEPR